MLEKIINSAKRIIGGTVLAGALLLGSGCDSESSWWDDGSDEPGPMTEETTEAELITEELGVEAEVVDANGCSHDFTRFSLGQAPIFPPGYVIPLTAIDRLVATIKDDDGVYNLFWLRDVDFIDRALSSIHLNDGRSFQGNWVQNNSPVNFYWFDCYANGMENIGGELLPMQIKVENMDALDIISSSFTEFDAEYARAYESIDANSPPAKKDVVLTDGRTLSTDLGYIIDCCGHGYSNTFHPRMINSFDTIETDGSRQTIFLKDLSEIELTGDFDSTKPQCRKAVLTSKTGAKSTKSIYLTSESYNGICSTAQRFREYDSIILHNENGAMIVPLNLVRKIIPIEAGGFDPSQTIKNNLMHEGMTLTSWYRGDYQGAHMENTLNGLFNIGVESVSVLATWYQDNASSTLIYPSGIKTPTDADIEYIIGRAKGFGMRTVLKPHVDPLDGDWRGYIEFTTEAEWADWFSNYRNFILHYAQIAEEKGVDMLVIGTELEGTVHRPEWNGIISDIRAAYSGEITYGANHDGCNEVPFWSQLDYIGVDAYFPLTGSLNPTRAELQNAWNLIAQDLEALSAANGGKKIMITEVGYQSRNGANISPWWAPTTVQDLQEQADCYNAMLNALFNKPFIAGIYPWMTYHSPTQDINGFDVLYKPAGTEISIFYHMMD